MPEQAKTIFSWTAPEFKHHPKGVFWYGWFGLVVLALLSYEIWRKDFFGAATIIILAIATLVIARHKPNDIPISLSNLGFHINDTHIPYKHIRKFWFVEHPHHNTLNIETSAYLNNIVLIELSDQDPQPIREFLRQILPEHEHNEPTLTQHISHHLKI